MVHINKFTGKTFQAAQLTHDSWADIKKIFRRSDLGSKNCHVLVVQLETFSP